MTHHHVTIKTPGAGPTRILDVAEAHSARKTYQRLLAEFRAEGFTPDRPEGLAGTLRSQVLARDGQLVEVSRWTCVALDCAPRPTSLDVATTFALQHHV